jgi:hypothetical protein
MNDSMNFLVWVVAVIVIFVGLQLLEVALHVPENL